MAACRFFLRSAPGFGYAVRRARLVALGGAVFWALLPAGSLAQVPRPQIAPPVEPSVQESMPQEPPQPEVKPWQPGDPVREAPDLRQDDPRTPAVPAPVSKPVPVVRAPVAPRVLDQNLRELDQVQPHPEGAPVRVVPDLRESGKEG